MKFALSTTSGVGHAEGFAVQPDGHWSAYYGATSIRGEEDNELKARIAANQWLRLQRTTVTSPP